MCGPRPRRGEVKDVEAGSRDITVRFFSSIRATFGQKEALMSLEDASTVLAVLTKLCTTPPRRQAIFNGSGEVRSDILLLCNGRNVAFLNGVQTPLSAGDVLSVFPPVKGG